MMAKADFPESYKDPKYAALDAQNEQRYELPPGIVSSVRLYGERSDHGKVSEAGARTVYQIIPATRDAAIKKYGIDPYLSPENAAEVAALLTKDSLTRNGGDVEKAVREFHGGTDPKNWGQQNNAYWQRVAGGLESAKRKSLGEGFAKWMEANPAIPTKQASPQEPPKQDQLAEGFGSWLAQQPQTPAPAQPTEEPGLIDRVSEAITGKGRRTTETEAAPDWTSMPELNQFSMASAKTGLGTVMSSSPEAVQVIQSNFPDVKVRQDEKGNYFLQSSIDGKEYAIKPGLRLSDLPRALAGVAAFTPAGRAVTLPGMAAAGAATQAVIEATQAATGGEFNPEDVALAGALPPAVSVAGQAVRAVVKPAAQAIQRVRGAVQPAPGAAAEAVPAVQAAAEARAPGAGQLLPEQPVSTPPVAAQAAPEGGALLPTDELGQTMRSAAIGGLGGKKATKTLAEQVAPDADTVAAAERLGITEHLQPDHVTTNQAYRQLAQLVKSQTGSEAAVAQSQGLAKVAERASNIVDELGGSPDLSTLSSTIKTQMQGVQRDLEVRADDLYGQVRAAVPDRFEAPAANVLGFIEQRAKELDGDVNLSSMEKTILRKLRPRSGEAVESTQVTGGGGIMNAPVTSVHRVPMLRQPTYALLDDVRKELGAAARQAGPFKDADTALAKKLYSLLSDDQAAALDRMGLTSTYDAARQTVAVRKGLEDDLASIFGKQLDRSMAPLVTGSMKKLGQGDTSAFIKLIQAVPEGMRQQVTASGLSSFFQRTARGGEMDFAGYARWFDAVKQNQQAYTALVSNLPKGAPQQLADLAQVSRGIAMSKGEFIATGKALNPKVLEAAESLTSRIFEEVKRRGVTGLAAELISTAGGMPGLATALQSATMASKPSVMQAADKLITSPEFVQAVRAHGTPASKAAVKKLAVSKAFKRFFMALGAPKAMRDPEKWLLEAMQSGKPAADKPKPTAPKRAPVTDQTLELVR